MKRLIESRAIYGKAEAREVLKELRKCKCDIFEKIDKDELTEYTFWFHCYCRYQIAKHNEEIYTLAANEEKAFNIFENALIEYDKNMQKRYFDDFAEKLGIDKEIVSQIPELFAIKESKEDKNNAKS